SGLQRFVMDYDREHNLVHPEKKQLNGFNIAIVGSGPAGLSCAARLASNGYHVEVFEKESELGGQLRLSIPDFRLPREVIDHEIKMIKNLGVKFNVNSEIKDPNELKKKGFDSIFVAPGLTVSKKLNVPGEDKKGVYDALDFLMRDKRGEKIQLGKRVLVVGGGDTAIDAARIARERGAQVLILYRRTQEEMPAYRPDIDEAFDEGVELWFRVVPVEVVGNGKVEGLKLNRVTWKGKGRHIKGYDIEGPEFTISGDTIINAIGQGSESTFNLPTNNKGWINYNSETLKVSDGVFVGGDFATGASTAVAAVAQGSRAATSIHEHLTKEKVKEVPNFGSRLTFNFPRPDVDISVKFCGVDFENPFILAAAPPSDDLDMVRSAFKAGWAGAVLKTTSIESEKVDLAYPMMTSLEFDGKKLVGMGNIDLISEHHIDVVEKRIKALKEEFPNKVVIASMMGSKKEEWQELARRIKAAGADMIECSFSCPQGTLGSKPGAMLSQDFKLTEQVAGWVKEAAGALPVVIKISPQVEDIVDSAMAVKRAGCDAVCASNTIPSLMGIDLETFIPNPNVAGKSTYSGMSGPAVKPLTLKCIAEISRRVGIPITGTGGPTNWRDAVEFMAVGASTVQFCTAVMHYGFDIIDDLNEGLRAFLAKKGMKKVSELIGKSLPYITTHDGLPRLKKLRSRIDEDKCINCGDCVIACRDGGHMAISWKDDRKPLVDDEKCVGCNLCKIICPVGCIALENIK
ncbi:NAD-dependent dihydropyrimidine dehydrogenase subunit PreA, partial [bacterium]|nr:NAD-dependent dihydropyrimidine dehydrogenase subunit PreA [bacterium]